MHIRFFTQEGKRTKKADISLINQGENLFVGSEKKDFSV